MATSSRSSCGSSAHRGLNVRYARSGSVPRDLGRASTDMNRQGQGRKPVRVPSAYDADASVEEAETSEYALSFLWLDKNLAVAVDQVFGRGHRAPITEYYWWPREDAWESLKKVLDEREAKAWIRSGDKVKLLNTLTDVINYWSEEDKPSVRDAISKYPDCSFQG